VVGTLLLGFPVAVVLSWAYELTPEGVKKTRGAAQPLTDAVDAPEPDGNSIAVLPFVNMSDDPGNEYFSDGIAEELLNLLSRIPELRVTSRSSAFSFKGQNLDIPEIASRLGVAHVGGLGMRGPLPPALDNAGAGGRT